MRVSLHFSQEAGTTRGIRPPPVGSPSFAELETRQPGVKSDSKSRGRQAQKSRATGQRTAIYRKLLIFRVAIGNLTVEANSAVHGPGDKQWNACRPRLSIPALMIGCAAVCNVSQVKGCRRARGRSGWRRSEPAGPSPRAAPVAQQREPDERLQGTEVMHMLSGTVEYGVKSGRSAAGAPCRFEVFRARPRRGRLVGFLSVALRRVCAPVAFPRDVTVPTARYRYHSL